MSTGDFWNLRTNDSISSFASSSLLLAGVVVLVPAVAVAVAIVRSRVRSRSQSLRSHPLPFLSLISRSRWRCHRLSIFNLPTSGGRPSPDWSESDSIRYVSSMTIASPRRCHCRRRIFRALLERSCRRRCCCFGRFESQQRSFARTQTPMTSSFRPSVHPREVDVVRDRRSPKVSSRAATSASAARPPSSRSTRAPDPLSSSTPPSPSRLSHSRRKSWSSSSSSSMSPRDRLWDRRSRGEVD